MNTDFFIKNPHSRFLEISGEDRVEFLQGLITNDIKKCKINNPIYSCFLSPQGKFLSDFFIIEQSNKYIIEIDEKYFSSFLLDPFSVITHLKDFCVSFDSSNATLIGAPIQSAS